MQTLRLAVALVFFVVAGVTAQEFDDEVSKHFLPASIKSRSDVFEEAKKQGKPVAVVVTQPWCGACKGLKKAVNTGSKVKGILADFVVVHAVGDEGKKWQESGHGYVPQTYWFTPEGKDLKVKGPNPEYAHFFPTDAALAQGMSKALGRFTKVQAGRDEAITEIRALYAEHAPEKVGEPLEALLAKYKGKEKGLLRNVKKKYGVSGEPHPDEL